MARTLETAGAQRALGSVPAALIRKRWKRLTDDDVRDAARDRKELARRIAERYGVSLTEAKRQVHEMEKVVHVTRRGGRIRGRRMRRTFERPGSVIFEEAGDSLKELRRRFKQLVAAGGLLGKSGTKEPPPGGLPREAGASLPGKSRPKEPPPKPK